MDEDKSGYVPSDQMIRILMAYELWRYERRITKNQLDFISSDIKVSAHESIVDWKEKKPRCYRLAMMMDSPWYEMVTDLAVCVNVCFLWQKQILSSN